ncbi:lysophospholipid acyltransferase family protein [Allohahella marinimesophila]|uniref:1-acyl-sn-glycerol-3-phosphate acyltransferase n=1 Tax=Allohahella marinimesophila TaxID=1054972 RepID=A0ABP7PQI3_9GAMM
MTHTSGKTSARSVRESLALLRGLIFYVGYGSAMALSGVAVLLAVPVCRFPMRYRVLSQFSIAIIYWARLVCGMRFRCEGQENIPATPCVVVSNHESAWETFFLGWMFRPQATVLKKELLNIPLFGWGLRMLRPIPLDRNKPTAALKLVLREGTAAIQEGCWVVIYPEGTRVRPMMTGRFNKGGAMLAIRSGVPILPVAHNAGSCWPAGMIRKYPGQIRVKIGAPIQTAGRTVDEVHGELEAAIRQSMQTLRATTVPL